ncbi:SET and MYND domain-containing protein 4-like [Aphidius gifuensis]|uniref:SET and MYND domain-containing protein 4-like n=1 Tax=Aphidius gifuensis TaxID=684658 RepID=UPI001CDBB05C|nr:SET and MYND domain-containing protein 4-like [Aphidius gifuensis]
MDFINPPVDLTNAAKCHYSQKTTFRDKFEVAWNFITPYITINHDKIDKTVGQSMIWREIGNKEYTTAKNKDYLSKSIKAYSESIAFAPLGSKELSLAYANRSAVLFRARHYEDCLLDIERALKSGYPDKLKTKLYLRQSLCFKALKPNSKLEADISMASAKQWLPNLKKYNPTYDLTEEYPKMMNELKEPREIIEFIPEIKNDNAIIVGASDAIELKETNDNNQHVVATRDIKTGEFIYISEPFAATVSDDFRFINCWHCCRQTWAGIPCDNCPTIIYCSDTCKKKAWNSYHNIECLVLGQFLKFEKTTRGYLLAIKLFSKTLNSVGGLIELKNKIENIDSMKNRELIFTNGILDFNTIDNFLNLDYFKATSTECTFGFALFVVLIVAIFGHKTDIFGKKMTMKDLINYKNEKLLILGELLLRFLLTVRRSGQSFVVDGDNEWSSVMLPYWKIIKPSCDPNVDWTHVGSNVGYFALKPIKQGEPILESIFGSYHTVSKTERSIGFGNVSNDPLSCECTACVENWSTIHSLPSYQSMTLPTRIKEELNCMMLELKEWQKLILQGDPKKLLTFKDDLNTMNDMFHQYITNPCREISELHLFLKLLYIQLHTVHDIDE